MCERGGEKRGEEMELGLLGALCCCSFLFFPSLMENFGWSIIHPIWNAVGGPDEAGVWGNSVVRVFWVCGIGRSLLAGFGFVWQVGHVWNLHGGWIGSALRAKQTLAWR